MKLYHIHGCPPFYTNTFLIITQAKHGILIDAGAQAETYNEALEKAGATLTHILLTHGHRDHIEAAEALRERWGCKVYIDPADATGRGNLPLSFSDGSYEDGGELCIDELAFKTWHTPGHTPGSWIFLCEDLLFTGDTLFQGSIGRTDMPGGSIELMEQSLAKIKALPLPDDTRVLPGHMDFTTLGAEKKDNFFLNGFFGA